MAAAPSDKYIGRLAENLRASGIDCKVLNHCIQCSAEGTKFSLCFSDNTLLLYHLLCQPEKIVALIKTKLGLNQKVFARNCTVKKINRQTAEAFLTQHHLMNATTAAFNYGLFHKEQLLCVASFSKGRKMNRLSDDKRSFELIRFCTAAGYTVTGGLSKIIRYFYNEKNAGDIMTYVDKQFSDGASFTRAGFRKHSETPPHYFLFDLVNHSLQPIKDPQNFDTRKYRLLKNEGNIKMIFNGE